MSKRDKVTEPLSELTLDTTNEDRQPPKKTEELRRKPKSKKKIIDSWEDDDESSGADEELRTPAVTSPVVPSAPPPTPFSATYGPVPGGWNDVTGGPTSPHRGNSIKRPEKTDAVARRMIAAGLGLKAPKQTEEQRAYQTSIREQEKKRREQEMKEEQKRREELEMAKAAVWED